MSDRIVRGYREKPCAKCSEPANGRLCERCRYTGAMNKMEKQR